MSVDATRWAHDTLAADQAIPRKCRIMLLVLAGQASYPHHTVDQTGMDYLALVVGACRVNAWKAVDELERRGLVRVTRRDGFAHLYALPVPSSLSTTPRVNARGSGPSKPRDIARNPARYRAEPRALSRDVGVEGSYRGADAHDVDHTAPGPINDEATRAAALAAGVAAREAAKRAQRAADGIVEL